MAFVVMLCLWGALPALAQTGLPSERDVEFEQRILARLAEIDPQAVPIFQAATQALDSGDYEAAQQGYAQVLLLAPGFPDAERRLSFIELELENLDAALAHANNAYEAEDTPLNRAALASAMLASGDYASGFEALELARSAADQEPDDEFISLVLLSAGIQAENRDAIRQASLNLERANPQNPLSHFFLGLLAAADGHWEEAERRILHSQELGMPDEQVQQALSETGISSQARMHRWARWSGYTLAGWLVGLAALFLAGILLSRLTLVSAYRPYSPLTYQVRAAERWMRNLYQAVIALTSAYFYLSIPLLILIVVALVGGIFYLFLAIGQIPIKLALLIGLAGLYTLYAVVRSVFTRLPDEQPGRTLAREDAPQLWSLVEQVAQKVETRPVDAIYVSGGTGIAVLERGGVLKKLRGQGERCLVLGLGALPGMTEGQFQTILAHEYGHFSNKDTAGGNFARQVQASIYNMGHGLASSGQANWYNPAWLFVNGFYRIFLRITLGASRLQEILADRYAILAYGARDFVDGLQHVVQQSIRFDFKVNQAIKVSLETGAVLRNLYTLPEVEGEELRQEMEQKIEQALNHPTSAYDSHPSIQERIQLARGLPASGSEAGSANPVWDLLPGAAAMQEEMTAHLRAQVEQIRLLAAQQTEA
ncbi:MAG: M48 family metalloprotease [Anaerolineales bacterium]|nr:M48 family metalloprotease [Anaerolineales bacterium]